MIDNPKCDFCDREAIAVGGELNELLLCPDHLEKS